MTLNRLEWLRFWLWWPIPFLLVIAVLVYGLAALVMAGERNENGCGHGILYDGADHTVVDEGYLPLRYDCHFEDGTVFEVVPDGTNVIVFGALAGAAACAVTAVRLGRPIKRLKAAAASPG